MTYFVKVHVVSDTLHCIEMQKIKKRFMIFFCLAGIDVLVLVVETFSKTDPERVQVAPD